MSLKLPPELAPWPEDPRIYAKIIEIHPEIERTGGMEIQQHVRKLWEAAAMWGYRDGYADGYDDGTEDKQRFAASARQPYEYEATVPTSTWTSPHPTSSRLKSPMFAVPQPIPFEEKDAAPWDRHDQRFSCRRITPDLLSSASASGMSHPVVFRASASSIRSSHRSSPYPRRSMSPSPLSLCPSPAERFACEACGKDFSRLHDRKRHYETQHGGKPVTHRCMYCEKDFSRADSLKRHLSNCKGP